MLIRAAVVGAGSWGTTVAHLLAPNGPTVLWARDPAIAEEVDRTHRNPRYFPTHALHPALRATGMLTEAVTDVDLVVMGVPSHGFRATLEQLRGAIRPDVPIVSLAKGLEQGTHARMTEIVAEAMPGHPAGVLTGPNLASEIIAGLGAASVLAMTDLDVALDLQPRFTTPSFRVYTNDDVVGCELAGSLKNVLAIALGMADGLGMGDNTRAALITRGLAELSRLGAAMGGDPLTFSGLAGMGDLVVTCISPRSRNHHVGEQLALGRTIAEITADMSMVAEGVRTAPVVVELAEDHGVDVPIARQVNRVLAGEVHPQDAYRELLGRPSTAELRVPDRQG